LAQLWDVAEKALRREWNRVDPAGSDDDAHPVKYEQGHLYDGGMNLAGYDPNGVYPLIRVWTDREPFPSPDHKPDLHRQPELDACDLAHEYGHFLSHQRRERTAEYEVALKALRQRSLQPEEKNTILAEEERAWRYAREELGNLGVTEWRSFEERQEDALASYRNL
jgi:hypothetical protein